MRLDKTILLVYMSVFLLGHRVTEVEAEDDKEKLTTPIDEKSLKEIAKPFDIPSNPAESLNKSEVIKPENNSTNADVLNTFQQTLQRVPPKLGLQELTDKSGLKAGLENMKQLPLLDGVKDTIKSIIGLAGQHISQTRSLVFDKVARNGLGK